MSTHNVCFHREITKNINTFWMKKNALSGAIIKYSMAVFHLLQLTSSSYQPGLSCSNYS